MQKKGSAFEEHFPHQKPPKNALWRISPVFKCKNLIENFQAVKNRLWSRQNQPLLNAASDHTIVIGSTITVSFLKIIYNGVATGKRQM
jgi:hypothetical protein